MGVSRSSKELGAKFARAGFAIGASNRAAVSGAALVYKEALLRNADRDSGGDRRLSQWKRTKDAQGVKLGAGYKLFGYENAKAVVSPRPLGVWAALEGGTDPHTIRPFAYARGRKKGLGRGGGTASKALKLGDGYAAYAEHPGTKPKHTFSDAVNSGTEAGAMRVFKAAHRRSLLEVFR
jgi:hypothetical protein